MRVVSKETKLKDTFKLDDFVKIILFLRNQLKNAIILTCEHQEMRYRKQKEAAVSKL